MDIHLGSGNYLRAQNLTIPATRTIFQESQTTRLTTALRVPVPSEVPSVESTSPSAGSARLEVGIGSCVLRRSLRSCGMNAIRKLFVG